MKRGRWAIGTIPAVLGVLLLPAVLLCQTDERNITTKLLLGNVVYAGDDQPAEQADVELMDAAGSMVATTVTSWGGEFHFAGVDPGEYLLSVDKPGCERLSEKVQFPLAARRVTLRLKRNQAAGDFTVSVRELSIPPKARLALQDGIALLKTDPSRAMYNLQFAVTLYPDYYEAYYVIGMADLMMQHLPEAEEAFRRSIELSEHNYARPLLALGAVLCDQEKFAEAETVTREGLELDDTPWIGHLLLARALFGLGRWNEAEGSAHEAIVRQPDVPDAYLLLAHIHIRQKKAAAVQADLDQFLQLEPDSTISEQARKLRASLWGDDQRTANSDSDSEAVSAR